MVNHDIVVRGADLLGTLGVRRPVLLQMNDEHFPERFLQDLLTAQQPPLSNAAPPQPAPASGSDLADPSPLLFQPVQRMINIALIELNCNQPGAPRVDPKRILSAGIVVRRLVRHRPAPNAPVVEDPHRHAAWMRNASGQWGWIRLSAAEADLDPDPAQRPALRSGDPSLDKLLVKLNAASVRTESTTPAFAAPPATCVAIGRTVIYGIVPTASSEVADAPAQAPAIAASDLLNTLPQFLRAGGYDVPDNLLGITTVTVQWMVDDYLAQVYPPSGTLPAQQTADPAFTAFQQFGIAVRMLATVFHAFDGSAQGQAILAVLNGHSVTFDPPAQQPGSSSSTASMGLGDFFALASQVLLPDPTGSSAPLASTQLTMPSSWDWLTQAEESSLASALNTAVAQSSSALLAPTGRFQDASRHYVLRMFVRLKSDMPGCPNQLVWSQPSAPFQIAPWFASGQRPHPPVPLPKLDAGFLRSAKPNCSFQVPGSLMGSMQGTSMSGLMSGGGGGTALGLDWICGFNIPLITICAFFVLNIFLTLLNIVFFWLPIIKICIPIPAPSNPEPDQ